MPHEGYVDPVTNDGPGFHSNMPVSELTERVTRAIEASDVSSTPPTGYGNHGWGDDRKDKQTLDRAPAMRGGLRKVGLAKRLNARS